MQPYGGSAHRLRGRLQVSTLYTAKRGKIEQRVEFHGDKVKENQTQESTQAVEVHQLPHLIGDLNCEACLVRESPGPQYPGFVLSQLLGNAIVRMIDIRYLGSIPLTPHPNSKAKAVLHHCLLGRISLSGHTGTAYLCIRHEASIHPEIG